MSETFSVEFYGELEAWDGEAANKEAAFEAAKQSWAAQIASITLDDVTVYDEDGEEV